MYQSVEYGVQGISGLGLTSSVSGLLLLRSGSRAKSRNHSGQLEAGMELLRQAWFRCQVKYGTIHLTALKNRIKPVRNDVGTCVSFSIKGSGL